MLMRTSVALFIGAIVSDLATQPQAAPAVLGVWEREGCVLQERAGVGANDATFGFSYKAVTLYDESLVAQANTKVEGNRLFLGERPQPGQDLCCEDRRARKLRSLPLIRR